MQKNIYSSSETTTPFIWKQTGSFKSTFSKKISNTRTLEQNLYIWGQEGGGKVIK